MKQVGLFKNENVPVPLLPQNAKIYGCIRSSNPFWFYTNVSPVNNDIEIELKIKMKDISQYNLHDGGIYYANWAVNGYLMMNSFENSEYAFKWHYGSNSEFFGTRTTDVIVLKQGLNQCYINGTAVGTSYTITNSTNYQIQMFKPGRHGAMEFAVYYVKIWKAGELIRHYIPYMSNDIFTMKDLVNDEVLTDANGSLYDSF